MSIHSLTHSSTISSAVRPLLDKSCLCCKSTLCSVLHCLLLHFTDRRDQKQPPTEGFNTTPDCLDVRNRQGFPGQGSGYISPFSACKLPHFRNRQKTTPKSRLLIRRPLNAAHSYLNLALNFMASDHPW